MKQKLPTSEKGIKNHIFVSWGIPDYLTPSRYTEARKAAKGHGADTNDRRELAVAYIRDCVLDNLNDKLKEIPKDVRWRWQECAEDVADEMIKLKWKSLECIS